MDLGGHFSSILLIVWRIHVEYQWVSSKGLGHLDAKNLSLFYQEFLENQNNQTLIKDFSPNKHPEISTNTTDMVDS